MATYYLRMNILPYLGEGYSSIDVFTIHHMWNIWDYQRLPMDEFVQDVFFESLVIITDSVGLTQLEGVTTMTQDHRHNLVLIVKQVAAMNVCYWNLVLHPIISK